MAIELGLNLAPELKLYRYVSLAGFLALVETKRLRLANVNTWDDPGEAILAKVPSRGLTGEIEKPSYSFHQQIYGTCWSRLSESDAMWRIYSPDRTGIQVATSVGKFQALTGVRRGLLADVTYFDTASDLLATAKARTNPLADALDKRRAFQHEEEVRFLTHAQFVQGIDVSAASIELPVDPADFIEGITLDPRTADWFVQVMRAYGQRAGLRVEPTRSALYESAPHERIGIERSWVPINSKRRGVPE